MNSITLNRISDGRVALGSKVLEVISSYRQDSYAKCEAGGVILGRHVLDSQDLVVDEATVPMAGDRRGRGFFYRGRMNHQLRIDEAWSRTGGTCAYLGEWHTHPEAVPNPSWQDLREWQRKLREDQFDGETLLFIIVGTQLTRVWEGKRTCKRLQMIGQFTTLIGG